MAKVIKPKAAISRVFNLGFSPELNVEFSIVFLCIAFSLEETGRRIDFKGTLPASSQADRKKIKPVSSE